MFETPWSLESQETPQLCTNQMAVLLSVWLGTWNLSLLDGTIYRKWQEYSCLENPRDREAWWAAVHRVAKSQTGLKRRIMNTCTIYGMAPCLAGHTVTSSRDSLGWKWKVRGQRPSVDDRNYWTIFEGYGGYVES